MNNRLACERVPGTKANPLTKYAEYAGFYHSSEGSNYRLEARVNGGGLRVLVQRFEDDYYDLYYYHEDVFAFDNDHEAEIKRTFNPNSSVMTHKFFFEVYDGGEVGCVRWAHDFTYPKGRDLRRS